jgi:hypothetical protein
MIERNERTEEGDAVDSGSWCRGKTAQPCVGGDWHAERFNRNTVIYLFIYLFIQVYYPFATVLGYEGPTPHLF